jgi:hypothetical protein
MAIEVKTIMAGTAIIGDTFEVVTKSSKEFKELLNTVETAARWEKIELAKSSYLTFGYMPIVGDANFSGEFAVDRFAEGVTKESMADCGDMGDISGVVGSGVVVRAGKIYPTSLTAAMNYEALAGAACPALHKLATTVRERHVQECAAATAAATNKELLMKFSAGKLRAINGGGYKILDQRKLFQTVETALTDNNPEFVCGSYGHEQTTVQWKISGEDIAAILDAYQDAAIMADRPDRADAEALVEFTTSDVGNSAATVAAYLKLDNIVIPLGTAMKVLHKGSSSEADFAICAEKLFAQLKQGVKAVAELEDVKIEHMANAVLNLASEIGISRRAASAAAQEQIEFFGESGTAADVVYCLSGAIATMQSEKASAKQITTLQENVARLLVRCDWAEYDTIVATE